jgi:dephospho-CoA kinase
MILGVTGGIGSGKSTVAQLLAERGACLIDADAIAREIVVPGSPVLAALVDEFGSEILHDDGTLHRAKLAAIAFAEPDGTRRLNAIMHPSIAAVAAERLAAADASVVVYDMPLLVETGQQELVDHVVVVDVPEELQVERAVGMRGFAEQDVRRRIAAQASRDERLAVANTVIDNSGTPEQTAEQVDALWRRIAPAASSQTLA